MSIYQIDLGLLKESEETYRESATELETYIAEATEEIGKVTEEVYAGDDADKLRDGISKHITGYFSDTKDMAVKVAQKLSLAHSMGQLCKKRCYDFIIALGGSGGGKPADCFTGLLYCDQEKITALKQTCTTTMQYGDLLKGKANTVKGLLDMLQMVTLDSSGYVGRIKTSCDKIDHLEEYSLELTKYAEYVEKMDESLQTGLKECMPEDYVMIADGVDDRQKYLDMEYDINELEELLNTPEEELTDEMRVRRDVLSMIMNEKVKQMVLVAGNEVGLESAKEVGETNNVKYNTWFYGKEVSSSDGKYYAWCSVFVTWCANQAGMLDGNILPVFEDISPSANESDRFYAVKNVKEWYTEQSRFYSKDKEQNYIPKVGDFIVFKNSHIGIVAGVDEKAGIVYTYEGNASNMVKALHYKMSNGNIEGYCSNGGTNLMIPEIDYDNFNNEQRSTR